MNYIQEELNQLLDWAGQMAGKLLLALVCLFIGLKLVKYLMKLIAKGFEKHDVDASVAGFLNSLIQILLYVLVVITAATIIGFEVTSFITILGSAGLAVGLALQGSLSNLAGGVLILVLKPFRVGDYIVEMGTGQEGVVTRIDIFYTRLTTADNRMVVVPNGNLSATSIVNVTANPTRRLDLTIGVAYDEDIDKVKDCIEKAILSDDRVLDEYPIDIFIDRFDSDSVTMGMRVMVPQEYYWDIKWNIQMQLKKIFEEEQITIPFAQMDVHLVSSEE